MAVEREKIYECEVKRRRVKVGGGYEPFWKVKPVAPHWKIVTPSFAARIASAW